MSLFDPQGSKELLDVLLNDRTQGSGETFPEPSNTLKNQLQAELLRIGAKMARSGDKQAGFEEAYSVFADMFQRIGATLTDSLLQIDIPNMLFNFAVKSGWFPHLGLSTDASELVDITSPKRVAQDRICVKGGLAGLTAPDKRTSIGWFKNQIRPAVLEWTAKALQMSVGCEDKRESEQPNPIKIARRKRWLEAELKQRGWTTGTLNKWHGPDRKTTESYLKGNEITAASRKAIIDALNEGRTEKSSRMFDISELPD